MSIASSLPKIEDIFKTCGSRYIAINYIARKARNLKEACYFLIQDSQAVDWAITGEPPSNLDELLKKKTTELPVSKEDRVIAILNTIDDDKIRTAVRNSYNLSKKHNQIAFDYNGIKDKGIRTRIRILTRMAFLP